MGKKTKFKFPTKRYLNTVKRGYKDCKLDVKTTSNKLERENQRSGKKI